MSRLSRDWSSRWAYTRTTVVAATAGRSPVAGAAALREMGSSSVRVCTTSSNVGGVATYKAAGFEARPEIGDRIRKA